MWGFFHNVANMCQRCIERQTVFKDTLGHLKKGVGCFKRTINHRINQLPKAYVEDLRKLMEKMQKGGGGNKKLTPVQQEFFKVYGPILRKFVRPPIDYYSFLKKKRRFQQKQMPFAQAYGIAFHDDPTNFDLTDIQVNHDETTI